MNHKMIGLCVVLLACAGTAGTAGTAWAQDPEAGDVDVADGAGAEAEGGASGGASGGGSFGGSYGGSLGGSYGGSGGGDSSGAAAAEEPEYSGDGGLRLAAQVRPPTTVLNLPVQPGGGINPVVPFVTPGVRMLDEGALFLGLGLGFAGISAENSGAMQESSQSGFAISPVVNYDLMSETHAAFYLLAMFNIAKVGELEQCSTAPMGSCMDTGQDSDGLGLNLGVGLRGKINEALAIGGEFGWGFLSGSVGAADYFKHGIIGALVFEASLGI